MQGSFDQFNHQEIPPASPSDDSTLRQSCSRVREEAIQLDKYRNKVKFGKPQNQNNMKKVFGLLSIAIIVVACSNDNAASDTPSPDAPKKETVSMPYKVEKTPDWEIGSDSNVAVAMNCLRAFETNDMNALGQYLADSVEFYVDTINFKGTKDELMKLMTGFRNSLESISIDMKDYESVTSKNRGEEWVGLWYVEDIKPKGGKAFTQLSMDDVKIIGGKIALIDSKSRPYRK